VGGSGSSPPDSPTTQAPTRHLVVSPGPKPALPVWEREEVQEMLWGETMKTLLVWIILASSALATEPRAVITGPKESRPGSLVVLDATESTGIGRMWLLAVSPEPTSFLPVENGLKCIFASPVPGEYVFILVVSGTNPNGGPAAAMAQHTVTLLGPRPPPITDPTKPPPQQATGAVYIFEKDLHQVPRPVSAALNRLNLERESFVAAELDQDVIAGSGQAPAQYQAALAAAKAAGLPALVVLGPSGVLRVVRDPKTEADVMEAVR